MSRILGIDFGTRRIGLALSDPTGTLASPLPCLENTRTREVTAKLNELIQLHGVESIVIGLPRNMDGSYGPSAEKVRQFIAEMEAQISAKIFAQDERLTTRQASRDLSGFG
ncbi:MAG: Holliday junction resolvase RuvX, partial [Verrucomicrobia bacterium]|nr:Holliday junction resolvase RuvX [Verrucomicrobiota bacterium]